MDGRTDGRTDRQTDRRADQTDRHTNNSDSMGPSVERGSNNQLSHYELKLFEVKYDNLCK